MFRIFFLLLIFVAIHLTAQAQNGGDSVRWKTVEVGLFTLDVPSDWQLNHFKNSIRLNKGCDTLYIYTGWNLDWYFRRGVIDYAIHYKYIAPAHIPNRKELDKTDIGNYLRRHPLPKRKYLVGFDQLPAVYFDHRVIKSHQGNLYQWLAYPVKFQTGVTSMLLYDSVSRSSLTINGYSLKAENVKTALKICNSVRYTPEGKLRLLSFYHQDCSWASSRMPQEEIIYPDGDPAPFIPTVEYAPKFLLYGDTLKIEAELILECSGEHGYISGMKVEGNQIEFFVEKKNKQSVLL